MTLLRKPVSITLIGLFCILAPLGNLAQILWVTGLPLAGGPVTLWSVLTPFDWAVLLAFPVVGWGVFTVHRWGWVSFVAFSFFLVGYNTYSFLVNRTYDLALVVLFNLGLVAVAAFFFRKHMAAPYFNPRLRWWNNDPRLQVTLPARVFFPDDHGAEAEVLDISRSGVFLGMEECLILGRVYRFELTAHGRSFLCQGKALRPSMCADRPGYGLMFEGLTAFQTQELKRLLAQLVVEGARERGWPADAPHNNDPFLRHLAWYARRAWREISGS